MLFRISFNLVSRIFPFQIILPFYHSVLLRFPVLVLGPLILGDPRTDSRRNEVNTLYCEARILGAVWKWSGETQFPGASSAMFEKRRCFEFCHVYFVLPWLTARVFEDGPWLESDLFWATDITTCKSKMHWHTKQSKNGFTLLFIW